MRVVCDRISSMVFEDAMVSDAPRIAAVIRAGFDPDVVGATIYGCDGVDAFIAEHIRRRACSPYRYKVARTAAGVVGAAEFRLQEHTLFLNYIAVDPGGQGQGIASRLLASAVTEATGDGLVQLSLDVFITNARAATWYERLGMLREYERILATGPLAPRPGRCRFVIPDLAQAEAVQSTFGFSEFTLHTADGIQHRVGRIGKGYFRLAGKATVMDRHLHACLASFDPDRTVLAILEEPVELDGWRSLVASRRMTAAFSEIRL